MNALGRWLAATSVALAALIGSLRPEVAVAQATGGQQSPAPSQQGPADPPPQADPNHQKGPQPPKDPKQPDAPSDQTPGKETEVPPAVDRDGELRGGG